MKVVRPEPADSDLLRDRAARLFRYLAAVAELRATAARDVASYEGVFWFNELPREDECHTAAWPEVDATDADHWLRIEKPDKPKLDDPPAECTDWYDASELENASAEPQLHDEIVGPKQIARKTKISDDSNQATSQRLWLSDYPHVATAWEDYLETSWRPWAETIPRWERVQSVYRKLFAIYQEQQRRGEQYELVVGVGTLVWTNNGGHRVCRPIVTARATIALDAESGCITVRPALDGANFTLEQDMLEVSERPPIQEQQQIERKITELKSHLDERQIKPILKGWLQSMPSAADTSYQDSLQCPVRASGTPQLAFAPVLLLRQRGAQTLREALRKIVLQLTEGVEIPCGVRQLCDGTEETPIDPAGGSTANGSDHVATPNEILFPLPTNDEQIEIVHRLGNRAGVLVQGPPGTGKSHTIVNLLCHFLSQGKRVLVTSQTPRALKVLREKIPGEILPLAVSLLGEDVESQQNLEYAVQGILRHDDTVNLKTVCKEIDSYAKQRATCLSRLAELHRLLRETREAETTIYSVAGTPYEGTAQAIAQKLLQDADRFTWLEDPIAETTAPPLTDSEFKELFALWVRVKDLVGKPHHILPDLEGLPTAEEFERAVEAWSQAKHDAAPFAQEAANDSESRLQFLSVEQLETLAQTAQEIVKYSNYLSQRTEAWIGRVQRDVADDNVLRWHSLEQATAKAIEALGDFGNEAEAELEISEHVSRQQVLADATDLLAHLNAGNGFGSFFAQPGVVRRTKYLWKKARFAGRQCNSPQTLESLIVHQRAHETLDHLSKEWADCTKAPAGTTRSRLAFLDSCRRVVTAILRRQKLVANATKILASVGERVNKADTLTGKAWAEQLLANANAAVVGRREREADATFSEVVERVSDFCAIPQPHPHLSGILSAAQHGDAVSYRTLMTTLAHLREEQQQLELFMLMDAELRTVAPKLADAIRSDVRRKAIAPDVNSFGKAWAHKRAQAWLDRFCAEHAADSAPAEVNHTDSQLKEVTEALVARKAWKFCLEQLAEKPALRGALTAWQQKVKKIGRSKGKYVETHRRDARKFMQQCRPAIPVWIMPLYRVAEQIEIEPEVFDVVIVDEASQTGPEGLLLQYLARQCIIVGDDKQISPEAGFIDASQVRALIEKFLWDVPFAETLDPGTSLFDQAAIRYGTRITLREHFRCMPEIIRFSNDLCYADTPLVPLRQYPPNRLQPIQVRFVTDGYREGRDQSVINRPEAAAVAWQVITCLSDPQHAGKSMGVVCLQGHAQAKLIESMILDKVGPQPFKDEKVRLVCGDPYSFQGDERDIIFLSMIASVDGERRNAPLVRESFRQRFNVAASRARDQLWLFHSIRESDLHPDCMRRRLVHFCYHPDATELEERKHAYESQFERDVAEGLIRAGFRVLSQFKFAGKRIDLVVQDGERRIAVECDGDAWHGPDEYEADSSRQRVLERCGWEFVRIRGSVFYANRAKAMQKLIETIAAQGIMPRTVSDDETAFRDCVQEISGNQCLEELDARTVDVEDSERELDEEADMAA